MSSIRINRYILLNKEITRIYIGNYIQYHVIVYNGKQLKIYIYLYI